jgi:hypothetical protein
MKTAKLQSPKSKKHAASINKTSARLIAPNGELDEFCGLSRYEMRLIIVCGDRHMGSQVGNLMAQKGCRLHLVEPIVLSDINDIDRMRGNDSSDPVTVILEIHRPMHALSPRLLARADGIVNVEVFGRI